MNSESTPPRNSKKKKRAMMIAAVVILVGLAGLFLYRGYAATHLSTDDAFVESSIHLVAARVPGTISRILVRDNQTVQAGNVLVELDQEPMQKAVEEAVASLRAETGKLQESRSRVVSQERKVAAARAALRQTEATRDQLTAGLAARRAEVQAKAAALDQARLDLVRAETLANQDVVPRSRFDQARTAFEMAQAALAAAEELTRQAQAAITAHEAAVAQGRAVVRAEEAVLDQVRAGVLTQEEQVKRRQTQVETAQLNLSYTRVRAPADGVVTRKSAEVGNTVQAGQPLMNLVNLSEPHIIANYKETRVGRIASGQKVRIRLDAYPGRKFSGTVDSIMVGTGSAFTLFPPENASGNYVKVVQRVPVKIIFDDPEEVNGLVRVGMSVVPTVIVE